jgi:hypothetical protein
MMMRVQQTETILVTPKTPQTTTTTTIEQYLCAVEGMMTEEEHCHV